MDNASLFPSIGAIIQALEAWAPRGSAQSYDNVGLQVGDAQRAVQRALIALDLTPAVVDEAEQLDATLIITHHPLIFRPLRHVTTQSFVSGLVLRLAEAGLALYSIHTNLDAAAGGVSFALAEQLGLQDVTFLEQADDALYKLTALVPPPYLVAVQEALLAAGARGIHYGVAQSHTRPAPGTGGISESAEEILLEAEVDRWNQGSILSALKAAHPHDDVIYHVYPVVQPHRHVGLGAVGHLPTPESLDAFLQRVAIKLSAESLRYVGERTARVGTVAVCGGSGSSFTAQALRAGADAFVTADVTYHTFFDVLDAQGRPRMALIDAGHYETEAMTERLLGHWLRQQFPMVEWLQTQTRTSPVDTYIPN